MSVIIKNEHEGTNEIIAMMLGPLLPEPEPLAAAEPEPERPAKRAKSQTPVSMAALMSKYVPKAPEPSKPQPKPVLPKKKNPFAKK